MSLILPTGVKYGFLVNIAATVVGSAAVAACTRWEAAKIVGMTVLTGVAYGTLNDLIACRDCIEYYTVGHFYDGRRLFYRLVNTLDPDINAIAWGMVATWRVALVAGTLLTLAARYPLPKVAQDRKVTASQLAPYLKGISLVTLLASHITSGIAKNVMAANPYEKYRDVPLNLQAGWEACNIRNNTGYIVLELASVVLSACIVAYRAGLIGKKEEASWYAKAERFLKQIQEQGLLASIRGK